MKRGQWVLIPLAGSLWGSNQFKWHYGNLYGNTIYYQLQFKRQK